MSPAELHACPERSRRTSNSHYKAPGGGGLHSFARANGCNRRDSRNPGESRCYETAPHTSWHSTPYSGI